MKRIAVLAALVAALVIVYVTPSSAAAAANSVTYMQVTPWNGLNVRSGPGLGNRILTAMPSGTVVPVEASSGAAWVQVTYHGIHGWSYVSYLRVYEAPARTASVVRTPIYRGSSSGNVVDIIYAAAARYNVDGNWLLSVARCESSLRQDAVGPYGEIGIFQFLPSTFRANSNGSIYNVWDQADTAARMFHEGQAHQWTCAR